MALQQSLSPSPFLSLALVVLAKSTPVHDLILPDHLSIFPLTVPCRIELAMPDKLDTLWPNYIRRTVLRKKNNKKTVNNNNNNNFTIGQAWKTRKITHS